MGLPALKKEFKPELQIDQQEMGSGDTFRYNVLSYVVEGNYDRAAEEIRKFLERDFEQPQFKGRVERYLLHAIDLVNAIRAKRNFPGANMLTMAKQKDLNDKFKEHFKELQHLLKKVEKIQRDVKLEDIRSTVLIVRAAINSIVIIALFAFAQEIQSGLFKTAIVVFDQIFEDIAHTFFNFL